MILRVLIYLFPQVRELQSRINSANVDAARSGNECSSLRAELRDVQGRLNKEIGQCEAWKARYQDVSDNLKFWREQLQKAEQRIEETEREFRECLKTASDSISLQHTRRRLFSKAPIEQAPAEQAQRASINLTRPFAGHVADRNTRDTLRKMAIQAGVIQAPTETQQPN